MKYEFDYLFRPGRWMTDAQLGDLSAEITALGRRCLEPLPDYQVFLGTRAAFSDKVLTTARDPNTGKLVAFCSCVLLQVPQLGEVIHLGLTCIEPELRGGGLSHRLAGNLLTRYVVTRHGLGKAWMTSVGCVLSILGNLARLFERVYPSPRHAQPFAPEVDLIATEFDRQFRHIAYVQPWAVFERESFVFRGSGRGTAFQKEAEATEFHHRDPAMNDFFRARLHFEDGDEMLQVVQFGITDLVRYELRDRLKRWRPR